MPELSKAYEPQKYEDEIYQRWEKSGFFAPEAHPPWVDNPDDPERGYFSVVLPPPNITDKLHLGHVVMAAITDILVRYNRMNGKRTLWIPGTDHAALATQNVVEKKLWQEKKQTRHDLGREKFLQEVRSFVEQTQATIIHQLRKTGASLDWSRLAFTLDNQRQKAVKQMFVDMYNEGVIYRGYRLVNWCPRCQSTLADDEVEYKEQSAKFYTFKYSQDFPFSISTTRPETKLGDTAVAVNPKDKRYKKYVGQVFQIDFCGVPLNLKIIADENVDKDFCTGALGVTPAHSFVDYEMARQNNLGIKKIINEAGKMADVGKYTGLSVLAAREAVVAELNRRGLLEKEEEIKNNLSVCSRCETSIEPLPSKQWFVAVDKKLERLDGRSLKEKALEVVRAGKIKFTPERFTKRYLDWMENLHDWCISRQIWYGHQIPVYYCKQGISNNQFPISKCCEPIVSVENLRECPHCGGGIEQEQDVLDTWFSSGMWTFSTMGYPDNFKNNKKFGDLAKFHPTSLLETGYEIITLWVSRMIMMSLFALQEVPFANVYLHGMVLDKNGKKMSKSKGNGIDPLEMINKYGTDAVRMSLIVGNTPGNDARISEEKIADFRNFANKLWNISRFIIANSKLKTQNSKIELKDLKLTLADRWILDKLNQVISDTTKSIEQFNFSMAGELLRDFTWNELADWYLEIVKIEGKKSEILNYILNTILKLWHPFMPFVTEAIWTTVYGLQIIDCEQMLMIQKWLKVIQYESEKEKTKSVSFGALDFELIRNIISAIRSLRAEFKIEPAKKLKTVISAGDKLNLLKENEAVIMGLGRLEDLKIKKLAAKPEASVGFIESGVEIYVDLAGTVDFAKEKARLEKEIATTEKYLQCLAGKLKNQEFFKNAPEQVVESEKEKMSVAEQKLEKLKKQVGSFKI